MRPAQASQTMLATGLFTVPPNGQKVKIAHWVMFGQKISSHGVQS
jgi:hypothetical protein